MNPLSIKPRLAPILRLCISFPALLLVAGLLFGSCGIFQGGGDCDCPTFSEAAPAPTEQLADTIVESTEKETVAYVE